MKPRRKRFVSWELATAGEVVDKVLRKAGIHHRVLENRVFQVWDRVCGGPIARNSRPARIEQGVLTVHVSNAAWMGELVYVKDELVERLNREIAGDDEPPVVRDLRLRVGRLGDAPKPRALPAHLAPKPPPPERVLTPAERAEAEALVRTLPPGAGRESLQRMILRSLERSAG